MDAPWISDPIFWVFSLPALAASGLLIQMILSLFSCCATFKIRGNPVRLKWWMIPAASLACVCLWTVAVLYAVLR